MEGEIMSRTTAAMIEEIQRSPWRGQPAKTIFFGGGTPTYLPTEQLLAILAAVMEVHPPIEGAEITSEANPGTVDADKFSAMREAGFNRISLGAQSFLDDDLMRLGRIHVAGQIEAAVAKAREAGFDNLNLDLMFALPGQSLRAWDQNLSRAIGLEPEHLSLYCLTLEPNTPFYRQHLRGLLIQPDEDDQVEMYELARERASGAGYGHYEISNFAKPERESRHNLAYWRAESYAGYGPGAVGFMDGVRTTNWKHPQRYIEAVESGLPTAFESETIDEATHRLEQIMLGLRLREGVPVTLADENGLREMAARGWIDLSNDRVVLTLDGQHFCSEVALALA
jgi:oxygen-independent coproporphyrinogen-3 oxidase